VFQSKNKYILAKDLELEEDLVIYDHCSSVCIPLLMLNDSEI